MRMTRYQGLVLMVAWMGWVFDIMDTALFNFAKGPMLLELLGPERQKLEGPIIEGRLLTIFLIGWSLGGLIFGVLADRWGRTRVMIATILIYSLFTGLTALCHTWEQVAAVRFVTALGIGGEWAAGAALIAETFSDKSRAPAASFLQSAAAFGPVFAALANFQIKAADWRLLFWIGVAPAIICVVIRFFVREPEKVGSGKAIDFSPLVGLFREPVWRRNALVALLLGVVGIAGSQNVSFWLPNLVEAASKGLAPDVIQARKSEATLVLHIGTLLGVFLMPWLCEKVGRRPAMLVFLILSPISVWLATVVGTTYSSLLLCAPLMSLFAIGLSAGFVLYFPELFPTRFRATGAGLAYNGGRILAAGFPLMTAAIMSQPKSSPGVGVALTAAVLAIGVLVLPFAPETRGKPLPD